MRRNRREHFLYMMRNVIRNCYIKCYYMYDANSKTMAESRQHAFYFYVVELSVPLKRVEGPCYDCSCKCPIRLYLKILCLANRLPQKFFEPGKYERSCRGLSDAIYLRFFFFFSLVLTSALDAEQRQMLQGKEAKSCTLHHPE